MDYRQEQKEGEPQFFCHVLSFGPWESATLVALALVGAVDLSGALVSWMQALL